MATRTKYTIPKGYRRSRLFWRDEEDARDAAKKLRKAGHKVRVVSTGKMYRLLVRKKPG